MENPPSDDFGQLLKSYMQRVGMSLGRLEKRSGVPKETIANWREGIVRRPRHWDALVRVAGKLSLDESDASRLLQSAHHQSIVDLLSRTDDEQDRRLFSPWEEEIRRRVELAPLEAPPLPGHFVPRPKVAKDVKNQLLDDVTTESGKLAIHILHGPGGIGKSTLAAALVLDLAVRARFPDGVLWAKLGPEPNLSSMLSNWIVNPLHDTRYRHITTEGASSRLRTLLQDKRCLLVIDDAWQADHVRPFLMGGTHCRVLITTRDATIALKLGAHLHALDVMTEAQALALFEGRLRRPLGGDQGLASALARELGFLPLALELAAAQIDAGHSWKELLDAFHQGYSFKVG